MEITTSKYGNCGNILQVRGARDADDVDDEPEGKRLKLDDYDLN